MTTTRRSAADPPAGPPPSAGAPAQPALVFTAAGRLCALPVAHVAETLRPQPLERIGGAPAFVLGVSVLRGEPVPVVDLGMLLEGAPTPAPARLVRVRVGGRSVALAVAAVRGIVDLAHLPPAVLPPLLADGGGGVEALVARDQALLTVLRAARVLPDDSWGVPGPPPEVSA